MKITEIIKRVINWINNSIGMIKKIGTVVLVVMLILSFIKSGCQRSELERTIERITGLNVQSDILRNDIKDRDSILINKDNRIIEIRDSLVLSQKELAEIKSRYRHLETDYRDLASKLTEVPADSSYAFLQRVYDYPGQLTYPFNEPQVKGLHLTYLERNKLQQMNLNFVEQIKEYDYQIDLDNEIISEVAGQVELLKATQGNLEQIVDNKDEIIGIKDKQIKQNKNRKTFWKGTTGVATVLLIIAIL